MAALTVLAIAPAAAWALPSPVVDNTTADFSAGTPGSSTWTVEDSLRLRPAVSTDFEGTALPAGWTATAWSAGGTATVADGAVRVDGARLTTDLMYGSGRVVEFRSTFTPAAFQHAGFGDTLESASQPWAIFGTGGGTEMVLARGQDPSDSTPTVTEVPVGATAPPTSHLYRIEWSATDVKYYVDNALKATHEDIIAGQMRPIISDLTPGAPADAVTVDWLSMSPYPTSGTFESRMLEADDARAVWGSLTAMPSSGVTFETRTGNNPAAMSGYEPLDGSGKVLSPPGKFIQYKVTLTTADANTTPSLDSVSISYEIDSTAPTTTIGGTGTTVTFSSPDTDVATFECSVDGGAFATCTSPKDYSALAPGSHTVSVRAIDKAGNIGPAVSRTVVKAGPPGGGIPIPPGDDETDDDTTAPDVTIGSRKLRASASGKVKLRLTCSDDEDSCEIRVRLKRNGKTLAAKTLTLAGGDSKKVTLKLSKKARRKLAARGRLNAKAVITASDEAGNEDRTKYSVTLRPR